jgi:plastocyanin
MHTVALQLAPILGAEKSKVPFYIAGGLLVAWALLLSLGIGARRSDFPANEGQQRAVMGITAILVLAAVAMAVVTSGGAKSASAASPSTVSTASEPSAPAATGSTSEASTGPSSTPATGSAKSSIALAANPEGQLSYNTKALSTKAGTVTITMANMSPVEHNVTVAEGGKVLGATPTFKGSSKSITLKLKPGKYTFFCSVPGHRQAGMEGTLTVS